MSASRRLRRQQQRESSRRQPSEEAAAPAVRLRDTPLFRLRRRVRHVLLLTTLIGLVILRTFHDPLAGWLQVYGLTARVALVLVLLSPALLTWLIGLGQLRDQSDSVSAESKTD